MVGHNEKFAFVAVVFYKSEVVKCTKHFCKRYKYLGNFETNIFGKFFKSVLYI